MTLIEFLKENQIQKSRVHLSLASTSYDNTDERIMYLSLPRIINGQNYLVLSRRLASLINKKRILLLDAEIAESEGFVGLITPKGFRERIIIDESARFAIATLLNNECLHSNGNRGDYLAINKTDYSAKFGNYEYEDVYETEYDEYTGSIEYPVGEKTLCPDDIRTHYLFDIIDFYNIDGINAFVMNLEKTIFAYRQASQFYSMIKKKILKLLTNHFSVGVLIHMNIPLGCIGTIFPDQDNGYDDNNKGEYYRDIEDLIYDEFEGENMYYEDGSSSYVPSLANIEDFVISSIEDYYECHLHLPCFYDGEDSVFLEWLDYLQNYGRIER